MIDGMKNHLKNKHVTVAIAFLVAVGFINAIGIINANGGNMMAQVLNVSSKPVATYTYGVNDNNLGQETGLTFKVNRRLEIQACSGGGGGGGGGRGQESGNNVGSGGGGGEGGQPGTCLTRTVKLRAGDTLRWLTGNGGSGGSGGILLTIFDTSAWDNAPSSYIFADTSASNGQNGGTTYVSINGVDVMQVDGGRGGIAGTNASGECSPGIGSPSIWYLQDHPELSGYNTGVYDSSGIGKDGEGCGSPMGGPWNEVFHQDFEWIGFGGWGGRGKTLNNTYSANRGWPGITSDGFPNYEGSYIFGGDGGSGDPMGSSGGGGGGGGSGLWDDMICILPGHETEDIPAWDNCIKNRGGQGGNGSAGKVIITVY